MSKDKSILNMQIRADIKNDLQVLADIENRSLANFVETILLKHISDHNAGAAALFVPQAHLLIIGAGGSMGLEHLTSSLVEELSISEGTARKVIASMVKQGRVHYNVDPDTGSISYYMPKKDSQELSK